MPKKYFEDQYDDEEVKLVFRKHPIVMRKGLVIASVALLLGVIPAAVRPELGFGFFFGGLGVGFLLAFLIMFGYWIGWHFSVFIVTDQRFIQVAQKGLFHRSVVDIALNQITMINYEIAGFQETLLGFGTIVVQTYVGDLTIKDVHHPAKIQKELSKLLRDMGVATQTGPAGQVADDAPGLAPEQANDQRPAQYEFEPEEA